LNDFNGDTPMPDQQKPAQQESPPQFPYTDPCVDTDDEINLLDLLLVLLKRKWLIVGIVFLAGVASVVYSLRLTNIYRSEASIVPRQEGKSGSASTLSALRGLEAMSGGLVELGGGGSAEKFEVVLKSRALSRRIVGTYDLMPRLFEKVWDAERKSWLKNPPPTFQDAYKSLMGMLTVSKDRKTEVLKVQFDHKDPKFAKEMVDRYLKELSESLREETLKDAEENQRFFQAQIERTPDVLLRDKIYALLAREIEKETFARAQKFYSFQVLDPPIVPDLNKRVSPKRSQICILSVVVAFFIAVFLAFFLEYLNRLKTEGPDRYQQLKDGLRLRRRKSKPQ